VISPARRVRAAACCGTGYGVGIRLARSEQATIGFAARYQDLQGTWSAAEQWSTRGDASSDRELRLELRALVKLRPELQIGAIVPFVATRRGGFDGSSTGGGIGDATALGRWDFVPVGGRGAWPGIAATLSVTAPNGRGPQQSRVDLQTDVTGLGAWEIRPGIAIEKSWWTGFTIFASSAVGLRVPHRDRDGSAIALGPRWTTVAAAGPSWTWGLGFLAGLLHEREVAPARDGLRLAGAGRARTAALLIASYEIDEHWQPFASVQWDLPIDRLGRNEPGYLAFAVGLRRVWGVYD
jgi:hypothetical protein